MTPKEKFVEMAKGITRPGIDEMMAWLEETDFYDAPAFLIYAIMLIEPFYERSNTMRAHLLSLRRIYANERGCQRLPLHE